MTIKFKTFRHSYFLTFLLCSTVFLFLTSCNARQITVTSVDIGPGENKTMKVCFSEPIDKKDKVYVIFNFTSKTDKTFKHDAELYGDNSSCQTFYVYAKFSQKFTSKVDQDFLDNQLNQGNIKTLNLQVFNKYGGKLLFSGTFKDL